MAETTQDSKLAFRRKFKSEINEIKKEEQSLADEGSPIRDNVWQRYEGRVEEYDGSFSEILESLGYKSLRDWMEKRKKTGLTTHVLDVMGGNGEFLRNLSRYGERGQEVNPCFDKSLVVTLADERSKSNRRRKEDAKRGISILAGDITSGSTWNDITEWQKSQSISGFDLVICRGVQGLELIPIPLYEALLERFYANTTNKDGIILSQVSHDADKHTEKWYKALSQVSGVKTFILKDYLIIIFHSAEDILLLD